MSFSDSLGSQSYQDQTFQNLSRAQQYNRQCLRDLWELEDGGATVLETLESQGEQIQRMKQSVKSADRGLDRCKRHLRVIEGVGGQIFESTRSRLKKSSESAWDEKEKVKMKVQAKKPLPLSSPSVERNRVPVKVSTSDPAIRLQEIHAEKDRGLDGMSKALDRIMEQQLQVGKTLGSQNKELDCLEDHIENAGGKLDSCGQKISKILS